MSFVFSPVSDVWVWGTCSKTSKYQLQVLQKRAVRFIPNDPYHVHSRPYFMQYLLLTIEQSLALKLAIYVIYKLKLNPQYIHDNYTIRTTTYTFRQPRARTNYGTEIMSHQIPQLLNTYQKYCEWFISSKKKKKFKAISK